MRIVIHTERGYLLQMIGGAFLFTWSKDLALSVPAPKADIIVRQMRDVGIEGRIEGYKSAEPTHPYSFAF